MPNYLIDEKKNLVENQGNTGGMIKKTYEFTISQNSNTDQDVILNFTNSNESELINDLSTLEIASIIVKITSNSGVVSSSNFDIMMSGLGLIGDCTYFYAPFKCVIVPNDGGNSVLQIL